MGIKCKGTMVFLNYYDKINLQFIISNTDFQCKLFVEDND